MSKKRLILASAILSVAALTASCGGGGGGTTGTGTGGGGGGGGGGGQQPPPQQPPASLVSTVLVQTNNFATASFERKLVELYSDGSFKLSGLASDAAGNKQLVILGTCPNGNAVFTDAAHSDLYFYNKATNSLVSLNAGASSNKYTSVQPNTDANPPVNANFVILDDNGKAANADIVVTCKGVLVDLRAISTGNDQLILTKNYVVYLDDQGNAGASDSALVIDATGTKTVVMTTKAGNSTANLDIAVSKAKNNSNIVVLAETSTNADAGNGASLVFISETGSATAHTVTQFGAAQTIHNKIKAIQVGNVIYAGIIANADINAADALLYKSNTGFVNGANCKTGNDNLFSLDGAGNLFCVDHTNNNKVIAIPNDNSPVLGPANATTANVNRIIGTSDGAIVFAAAGDVKGVALTNNNASLSVQGVTPALDSAATICSQAAAKVRNEGTSNTYCTFGTTTAPIAGPTLAVIPNVNNGLVIDVDGSVNTNGVVLDSYGQQIAGATSAIFGDTNANVLYACTISGLSTSCKALTNIVYGDIVNRKDAFYRRPSLTTRIYGLPSKNNLIAVVDLMADSVKINNVNAVSDLNNPINPADPATVSGAISKDNSLIAVGTVVGATPCAALQISNSLAVGTFGGASPVFSNLTNPIFTGTVCLNSIFGVY